MTGSTMIPPPIWDVPALDNKWFIVRGGGGYWSMKSLRDAYYSRRIFDLYESREVMVIDWFILKFPKAPYA